MKFGDKKPSDNRKKRISLGCFVHFSINQIANKAIQTFALLCSKIFDDLPLAFPDNDIDAVVGLLIISCSCFFLRIRILHGDHPFSIY